MPGSAPAGGRLPLMALAVIALAACAAPARVNVMGPSGSLEIIAVTHDLERQVDSGELSVVGDPPPGAMSLTRLAGRNALRLAPSDTSFALVRSVAAILTASPYLEWSWAADWAADRDLPLVVLVGLVEPASDAGTDDLGEAAFGVELPPSHLLIAGLWRASPLQRGHLEAWPGDGRVALYSVRGGAQTVDWHRDGLDLENLVHRAWPGRDPAAMEVAYVAVVAGPDAADAYLADMVLHR